MTEESRIALIVASITLATSLAGTVLGGKFNQWQWERQSAVDQKRAIFEQRVKLIERTSVIINSAPRAQALQARLELDANLAQLKLACADPSKKGVQVPDHCKRELNMDSTQATQQEQVKLMAEFSSTLQLAALYFGPKTRSAIAVIPPKTQWWKVDDSILREILRSMADELVTFEG
jgi:hypothetical protein